MSDDNKVFDLYGEKAKSKTTPVPNPDEGSADPKPPLTLKEVAEILGLGLCILAIDLILDRVAGFPEFGDLPYWLPALFFAATQGRRQAAISLSFNAFLLFVILPILGWLTAWPLGSPWSPARLATEGPLIGAFMVACFFASARLDGDRRIIRSLKDRLRMRSSELKLQRSATRALSQVNRNLEERLVRNDELLTSLWRHTQSLYRMDVRQHLEEMANIVTKVARVSKLTIYRFDPEDQILEPILARGDADSLILGLDDSIEGWVFRNNAPFSIRMLLDNQYLAALDLGRTIMAFPIVVDGSPFAVLNIEDMDFVKYSTFTEELLSMLIFLGRDALEQALDNERALGVGAIDDSTGLARADRILSYLEGSVAKALARDSSLSYLVLQISNAEDIRKEHPDMPYSDLVRELSNRALGIRVGDYQVFMAPNRVGIALVYPGKDRDGISQFTLELLGRLGTEEWRIGQDTVQVETLVGVSSLGPGMDTGAGLMDAAERLIELQRGAR